MPSQQQKITELKTKLLNANETISEYVTELVKTKKRNEELCKQVNSVLQESEQKRKEFIASYFKERKETNTDYQKDIDQIRQNKATAFVFFLFAAMCATYIVYEFLKQ